MKMIKKMLMVLAALLLVTSCAKVDDKIEKQIPADAALVAKANLPQLMGNLDIAVKDGKLVLPARFAAMLQELGIDTAELDAQGAKLLESGLDLEHSVYCFVPSGDKTLVALLPVKDADKVKAYVAEMAGAAMLDKDGLSVIGKDDKALVLGDGILYVLVGNAAKDPSACVSALAKLDKSMKDNAAISGALGTADDVNLFVDGALMKEVGETIIEAAGQKAAQAGFLLDMWDMKSATYHVSLAGKELNVKCNNDVDDNSEFAKLISSITAKPSGDVLPLLPAGKNSFTFCYSLNGEGITNLDNVKKLLDQNGDDPTVKKIVDVFKSINGPVAISITSDELSPADMALSLAVKCGKAKEAIDLYKEFTEAGAYRMEGDEIVQPNAFNGMDGRFGVKGDVLYAKVAMKDYSAALDADAEAKGILSSSYSGVYAKMDVDNCQLMLSAGGPDIKDGSLKFNVKEDGKNVNLLDGIASIMKLAQKYGLMADTDDADDAPDAPADE